MGFDVLTFMGEAGHGKDEAGKYFVDNHHFVRVAFADPLKRLAQVVFGFSTNMLWGPSSMREKKQPPQEDLNHRGTSIPGQKHTDAWDKAQDRLNRFAPEWVGTLALSPAEQASYLPVVQKWFAHCRDLYKDGDVDARVPLQLLGTEYGRAFKQNLWIATLFDRVAPRIARGVEYSKTDGLLSTTHNKIPQGIVIPDCRFKNEMQDTQQYGGYVIKIIRKAKEAENDGSNVGLAGHASELEQRSIPEEAYNLVLRVDEGIDLLYESLNKMYEDHEYAA